jgi:hypothetical protein
MFVAVQSTRMDGPAAVPESPSLGCCPSLTSAKRVLPTTEEGYRRLIREAGFTHVANIVGIMGNAMCAWIAR